MPQFSLISAVYNVEAYLPDFLRSLDDQTFDHREVQVVLVDDGSTDSSATIIEDWAAETDYLVTVIHQANAGQSAARNVGLEQVLGEWVSFPDPDDILDADYLRSVHSNLKTEDVALVATHLVDFWEAKEEIRDSHPLRFRFRGGTQLVDIDRFPRNIQLSAASAFFRHARLETAGIRFDARIRPVFEDAHFVQRYLLASTVRLIAFDDEAKYLYRRRADGSSTLQTSGVDGRRYTDVLRFGLLDLLERADRSGHVPRWLQNVVLYDLFWVLRSEESLAPKTGHLSAEVADEFVDLMMRIRRFLDAETIEAFDIIHVSLTQREAMLHSFSGGDWSWDLVQAEEFDEKRNLVKLRYHFTGTRPEENLTFRGLEASPMYAKTRSFKYLGHPLLHERILWVSARGTITMRLNGRDVPIEDSPPAPKRFVLRPARSQRLAAKKRAAKKSARRATVSPRLTTDDRLTSALASSARCRRKFDSAWVFMDRAEQAGDNAEHLFKYVRSHHPECNAWFVVKKGSADWDRLTSEGIGNLIAYGSRQWKALCLNAELLVSSHIDADVIKPFTLGNGRQPEWEYVFLQHGVIKDDMAAWLNSKRPRLVVTTTEPEHRSIVGDGSSYVLSTKDTAMTGLPRYDRLARLDGDAGLARESTITIMPTWRKDLVTAINSLSEPGERLELFRRSDWWQQWLALINSSDLRTAAQKHGLRVRFMPHPGVEQYIEAGDLPDHVELVRHSTHDFQTTLVETAMLITDFSSVSFDAAYIDRPVMYFQFDADSIYGGGHIAKPGYFSFEDDGFGPVAATVEEAAEAVESLVSGDDPRLKEYARRRTATFTLPKSGNCERTYKAIVRSLKVVSPKDGIRLHPSPQAQPTRYLGAPIPAVPTAIAETPTVPTP